MIAQWSDSGLGNVKTPDPKRIQWEATGTVKLELAGWVRFTPGHRGAAHDHPFWELIFIGNGKGTLHRPGGARLCGSEDMILVPPGESHQFIADAREEFDQLYLGFSFDASGKDVESLAHRILDQDQPLADLIRSELRRIHSECAEKGEPAGGMHARFLPVICRLVQSLLAAGGPEEPSGRTHAGAVSRAKAFLTANLQSKLSVNAVARHVCMSAQYFGEVFKRETGSSLKEYQTNLRMVRAKELLQEGRLTIAEVADAVGLEDPAYFSRVFKSRYRVPPRSMRVLA